MQQRSKYPDFIISTGFGTMLGLAGINCRHSVHLIDPAVDKPTYTKESLAELNDTTVRTPKGETLPVYDATQQQRAMERRIRALKREKLTLSEIGASAWELNKLQLDIKSGQQQLSSFCKTTGLPRQYDRERI